MPVATPTGLKVLNKYKGYSRHKQLYFAHLRLLRSDTHIENLGAVHSNVTEITTCCHIWECHVYVKVARPIVKLAEYIIYAFKIP